jgi:PQQ system protein
MARGRSKAGIETDESMRHHLLVLGAVLLLTGCGMARLMQGMMGTNEPNEMMLGQMFANGGGGQASAGQDGIMRIAVKVRPGETLFRPAVIMMERPGELEIDFRNDDPQAHVMAVLPSNGGQVALDLPPLATGRARIELGSPGMYMFGSAMGDQLGRGMMGMVLVRGEVPPHAKLDRPAQPRP